MFNPHKTIWDDVHDFLSMGLSVIRRPTYANCMEIDGCRGVC